MSATPVSTRDQNGNLQTDALSKAGCEKIFTEKVSGAQRDRPELKAALEYIRVGDMLVVWKLDRLVRSLKQLIETVEMLDGQGIGFRSLTENIDTTTSGGKLVFHIFGALAEFERSIIKTFGVNSFVRQAKLGASGRVKVPTWQGFNCPRHYRVLRLWRTAMPMVGKL